MPHATATLTFVGTATTVMRIGSFTLLTDPNLLHQGQRAHLGKGLWSRRLTEPSMQPSDLPPLDAIVLSHLHGDHFDRVARAELRLGLRQPGLETWQHEVLSRDDETLSIEALPGHC